MMDKTTKTAIVLGGALAGFYLITKGSSSEKPIFGGGASVQLPSIAAEEVKVADVWEEKPTAVQEEVSGPFGVGMTKLEEPIATPRVSTSNYFTRAPKLGVAKKEVEVERVETGAGYVPKDIMYSQTYGKIVGGIMGRGYQPKAISESQTFGKVGKAIDSGVYTPKTMGQTGKVGGAQDAITGLFGWLFGLFDREVDEDDATGKKKTKAKYRSRSSVGRERQSKYQKRYRIPPYDDKKLMEMIHGPEP